MKVKDFNTDIFKLFDNQWALVTVGNQDTFNTMTISWGTLGSLWGNANQAKNICSIFVKPVRYTHEFLEESDYFTVSFLPESLENRKAYALLGSKSGRDTDKVAESGLTPKFLEHGVTFDEAETVFVCHKIFQQKLDKANIPQFAVDQFYAGDTPADAPHDMFVGEVEEILVKSK